MRGCPTVLCAGYDSIKSALHDIAEDDQQNGSTRHEADCLTALMDTLETALMSDVWSVVLSRYNETSIKSQSSTNDLKLSAYLLESLHEFTDDLRNRFDKFEDRGEQLSNDYVSQNSTVQAQQAF